MRKRQPLVARIIAKIHAPPYVGPAAEDQVFPFDGRVCWEWVGAYSEKQRRGSAPRPVIQLGGRGSAVVHVFRIMLSLFDGTPLGERGAFQAAHRPSMCRLGARCVNPLHGYWAGQGQNQRDNHFDPSSLGEL